MTADRTTPSGLPSRLHISVPESARLALTGELDADESDSLRAAVSAAVARRPGGVIEIDASGLTFLDSGGIRALLFCRKDVVAAGGRLTVVDASEIARQVLEMTGLLATLGVRSAPLTSRRA